VPTFDAVQNVALPVHDIDGKSALIVPAVAVAAVPIADWEMTQLTLQYTVTCSN
jgi:hypothetical protein